MKHKTKKSLIKAVLFLIIGTTPFILIDVLIKTESLTTYTSLESTIIRVIGIYVGFLYANGIYGLIYRKTI